MPEDEPRKQQACRAEKENENRMRMRKTVTFFQNYQIIMGPKSPDAQGKNR